MNRRSRGLILPKVVFYLAITGVAGGCGAPPNKPQVVNTSIPAFNAAEDAYCGSPMVYTSGTVTISGAATYQAREPFGTAISGGLGSAGSPRPIRYAELYVRNSSGAIIQCAETNANGGYQVIIPQSSTQHTIEVRSRSFNSQLKAYVYDDPRVNNPYKLIGSFTPSSSKTLATLNAEVTGAVLGGAFNILDQFLKTNEFLRTQVANCSASFSGCPNFTVAPRVTAYWKPGFNPGEYVNSGSLSFYLPGYSRLFVLGGNGGDTDSTDTDHFDNSVIIHEYGHFLEDVVFASDSPGGAHNGNSVIDPRLAWSEGWGNFLQAAVQDDPRYLDTIGNSDGPQGSASTDFYFYVDLESITSRDVPDHIGEGNFREFSVTRLLWDAIDSNVDSHMGYYDNVSSGFPEVWNALMDPTAWLKSSAAFRSIGHLHLFQGDLGAQNWSNLHGHHQQAPDTQDYAQYVSTSAGSCTMTLTPVDVPGDAGSLSTSHLLLNNDFYHLRLPSSQAVSLQLVYVDDDGTISPATDETDLDLYLYDETARFGLSSSIKGQSINEPDNSAVTSESEQINLSLPAGNYLINVNAFTGNFTVGTNVRYHLYLNGSPLCPDNLP